MMVGFLYILPLISIFHVFFTAKAYVRTVALSYSLFTFVYACALWYMAEFDSNRLAYVLDITLNFIFPLHFFSAIDPISFCFILLSLLLYPSMYFSFVGIYYC
jgi:NADH:ubiquinone oxidoreductase subunit 4 (subunit M)